MLMAPSFALRAGSGLKNRPVAISWSPREVGGMGNEGMTNRHLLTRLRAVGADLHDGDALSARRPSGLNDALSVRTIPWLSRIGRRTFPTCVGSVHGVR